MLFSITLYTSLVVFGIGLIYRLVTWLKFDLDRKKSEVLLSDRIPSVLKAAAAAIFSRRLAAMSKAFILDGLLQARVLRDDPQRWLMHIFIYCGFMFLLLVHALDVHLTAPLFPDYASTLNPWLFLRNLAAALVLVGIIMAVQRRLKMKKQGLITRKADVLALLLLGTIMVSGLLLEATKILSRVRFEEMVEEYSFIDGPDEIKALKVYWAKNFGVVFPAHPAPEGELNPTLGQELHQDNCAGCHSRPVWAFVSYPAAVILKTAALKLTELRLDVLLWQIHFIACFFGLAYLPFSKFLHILTGPLNILAKAAVNEPTAPEIRPVKQALELDACTRCQACSLWCSVAACLDSLTNQDILPSERLLTLEGFAARGNLNQEELKEIFEGTYSCTLCGRCQAVCPVSIDLRELWISMRGKLVREGAYPDNLDLIKQAMASEHNVVEYPNEERAMWVEFLDDPPDDLYIRAKARVVYFIGCIASFSPAVQGIPEAFCEILSLAEVDFTILGEEEWCCGFPLLAAGMPEGVAELKKHNIQAVRATGADTVVFACPSCYHTWVHEYGPETKGLKLWHTTTFLEDLIDQGRIAFSRELTGTVTYHDPCDLGRNSNIYLAPRRVIQKVPGLKFVELSENSRKALCCGGGGDVEIADASLTAAISTRKADQIQETGADTCITACQQCVRTIKAGLAGIDSRAEVLDLIQLVRQAMS